MYQLGTLILQTEVLLKEVFVNALRIVLAYVVLEDRTRRRNGRAMTCVWRSAWSWLGSRTGPGVRRCARLCRLLCLCRRRGLSTESTAYGFV